MISEHDIEEWKPVPIAGYETHYEISNRGRVRRIKNAKGAKVGAILKPNDTGTKLVVSLKNTEQKYSKKVSVHRMVLLAFKGPCPDGMEGCHNNGNHTHNWPSNLRWDTHHNNILDAVKHGTTPSGSNHWTRQNPEKIKTGEQWSFAKLTDAEAAYIFAKRTEGFSGKLLAKQFNVSQQLVCNIFKSRTRKLAKQTGQT